MSLVSGSEMFLLRMVMSRFSVKNFCLTVPKTSVEEQFFVSKTSRIKIFCLRGFCHDF